MCQSLFFNKVAGLRTATSLKKETLAQVFSCEFCEISTNTFSYRTPQVAVSAKLCFEVMTELKGFQVINNCRKPMPSLESHNDILVREIVLYETCDYWHGSTERGLVWKGIVGALMKALRFKLGVRSGCGHYKLTEKKFKKEQFEEVRGNGINTPEESSETAWNNSKADLKFQTKKSKQDYKKLKESKAGKSKTVP